MLIAKREAGSPGLHGRLLFVLACAVLLGPLALGQQPAPKPGDEAATIFGTVKDTNGNVVPGAAVTLAGSAGRYSATASANGFFTLTVSPGTYAITISSPDMVAWRTSMTVAAGAYREIPGIVLQVKGVVSTIQVNGSEKALATRQVKIEEEQRILGAIPNFYVSYFPNAAPLSARQKYSLAWRYSIDPVNILVAGITAGIEQAEDTYPGYGQGAQGYAKRFGAANADDFVSNMIGGAILPSLLHQDPRFYYRATGSVASRFDYAVSTVFICKGDNGKWEPNYSFVVGNFASGAVSNLYYPKQDRGVATTMETGLINTAMGAVGALAEEFLLRRFTTHSGGGRR